MHYFETLHALSKITFDYPQKNVGKNENIQEKTDNL